MPFSQTASGSEGDSEYLHQRQWQRAWNRQPPPYKGVLEFQYGQDSVSGHQFDWDNGHDYEIAQISKSPADAGGQHEIDNVLNRSYGAMQSQLGQASQMANNLLEMNQTVSSIVKRANQLTSFAHALSQGKFQKAANILVSAGHPPGRSIKPRAKNFADQFLEVHFGWVPLVQDIHNAVDTLQAPDNGAFRVFSSNQSRTDYRFTVHGGTEVNPYLFDEFRNGSYRVKMGAFVRVSSPNAYVANQLGLVNPASIAWEAVPYSFVVDWFSNVGQCLSAMTDFVGLSTERAFTTTSTEITWQGIQVSVNSNPNYGGRGQWRGRSFNVHRYSGIAGPVLKIKPFHGLSLTRGVTAISLLIQKLR